MVATYRLAEYDDYDHEAVVHIARAIRPDEYISVDGMTEWEETQRRANRLNRRWLAYVDGAIAGSGVFGQSPWLAPDAFQAHVMVHPERQGLGIGRSLLARIEASAVEAGARTVSGGTSETQERAVRVLAEAGYEEVDREWESTLDLATFQPDDWRRAVQRVREEGIQIVPVSDLDSTRPSWKADLHRLYVTLEADVPSTQEIRPLSLADFERLMLGRQALTDGFLVAIDDGSLVGLTEPRAVDDDPAAIQQELTGVLAAHRGRGIATALKVAAAMWAAEQGYTSIRTYNAQSNASMLAVNIRLGFVRGPAQIEFLKNLGSPPASG